MPGPLHGIRVLDLSRILAGPWSTQLLSDYGAEVIKIERPGVGDDTRHWGPPYLTNVDTESAPEAAYFLAANRGKRSITVDIGSDQGREIVYSLVKNADIFIENYKVGDMARYRLDYETLSSLNSRLVYCSITGFGQSGPYSHRPGYDFLIQAMGGLMSVTGLPDEQPGGGVMKCGVPVADLMTGMYATSAILAALLERLSSGVGQHIDMSLLDVQVAWLANQASNYLVSGKDAQRLGNAHPNLAPYQTFRANDGEFIIAVGNDRQFRSLCVALAAEHLALDPRFATNELRVKNRDALVLLLSQILLMSSQEEWLSRLQAAGVPVGPVNTIAQALKDEHVLERGMVFEMQHSNGASAPMIANPVKFSRSQIEYRRSPPSLGEHTNEILTTELGWSTEMLDRARKSGAI